RALPISNVRLIPQLPIPGADLFFAVTLDRMEYPLPDQLRPLRVILRRIGPAGVNLPIRLAGFPVVAIRLRLDGHSFGHKADFDQWPCAGLDVSVEDLIYDLPVINRLARRVFGISVCGTPFQSGLPIASDQQAVRAEIDRNRIHLRQLGDELLPVLHVSVVRLVITDISPDRFERAYFGVGVHADCYRFLGRRVDWRKGYKQRKTEFDLFHCSPPTN